MTRDDATTVVHAGEDAHRAPSATWPIVAPIVQAAVFAYPDIATVDAVHDGEIDGYIYGRYGVANHAALEQALAALEGAEAALATTSGTSAIATVLFGLLEAGDRVVAGSNIYGGTRGLLDNELRRLGIVTDYVQPDDHAALEALLGREPRPRLLWLDTLGNPSMLATDIPRVAALARAGGVPLVIDNTFATPLHCNPLALGASLVVHSTTKFISGHNDTSGGAVLGDGATIERLRRAGIRLGAIGAPFEAWLVLRGLRTLDVRLRRSSANALALARALAAHPAVTRVLYPGLPDAPGHAVAARVLRDGFGSMLSVDLGSRERARALVDALRIARFAETLGGLMTTVVHPPSASYRALDDAALARIGVTPGLLRISVGIESADDLVADFVEALG